MILNFLKTIKRNRDLIQHLILFDLKSNVARTYFGFLWWILDPIFYMLIFYFLVQVVLQRGGSDYSVFLFTALIPLKWTISSLTDSTKAISSKSSLLNQIYVPKSIFVVVRLGINSTKFLVGLVVLFLFLLFYGIEFSTNVLYLPVILIVHVLLLFGAMLILAHLGVYLPDIRNIMQYVTRMLFYISPVMFSLDSVSAILAKWLYLNPLTILFESYRNVLLYQKAPLWSGLVILLGVGLVILVIGIVLIEKFDKKYIKVI